MYLIKRIFFYQKAFNRIYPETTVTHIVLTLARILSAFTFATVNCTVDDATPVSGDPIEYHVAPSSSDPSICSAGGVDAVPRLNTNCTFCAQLVFNDAVAAVVTVVNDTTRSIICLNGTNVTIWCVILFNARVNDGVVPAIV